MTMYRLELEQRLNGKFHAWMSAGVYRTAEEAKAEAELRGYGRDEYMISDAVYDPETDDWE